MAVMTYTEIRRSLLDSAVWGQRPATRLVFVTMLALCDDEHRVLMPLPALARYAGVTQEDAEIALEYLTSPDQWNAVGSSDGRHLEVVDRGWRVINFERFALTKEEIARKSNAARQAAWRRRRAATAQDR